jgi:hypothetical protein
MSEYLSGDSKYTVYFIGDATHCVLGERSLKPFKEYFKEYAQKPQRKVIS